MAEAVEKIEVFLEVGRKRTFAGAIEWPGWCLSGRDEASALHALIEYGPRYERALSASQIEFKPPADESAFTVVERVQGNATTDFGAPDAALSSDVRLVNDIELQRLQALLEACWAAFDRAVQAATGKELRKGPRGGGRDLEGIIRHVLGADAAYLARLGWKLKQDEDFSLEEQLRQTRRAILDGLEAAVHGKLPERGPRGGVIWKPRAYMRRTAWHVLDHAWEIEDRIQSA